MNGFYEAAQLTQQILSNPSWSGISSLCSLIGIPLAIILARKSQTPLRQVNCPDFKKPSITLGAIPQRFKSGNQQITNILLAKSFPLFTISRFYSTFKSRILGS